MRRRSRRILPTVPARGLRRRVATLLALGVVGVQAAGAQVPGAPICRYEDAEGAVTYSNVDVPNARRVSCMEVSRPPAAAAPAPSPAASPAGSSTAAPRVRAPTPTPASFPRVDSSTQKSRDDLRRRVLDEELANELKLLAEARSQYNNGAPAALPEEQGNPQKLAERIARLRQAVQLHERNIAALRKELASVR